MDLGSYKRRILLCVTGLTPQIITETLYALAVKQTPPFIPTEIHLITTAEGAIRAKLTLLDPDQGQFHRLCADYGLNEGAIEFNKDTDTIHVITNQDGVALPDIRTPKDNEAAANAITDLVRSLTVDPEAAVHASIAGGRKTMGFYLGYAMSLFGRPQDRLSHVLVSTDLESHPQFFFPPCKPRVLFTRENRPVHTDDVSITLADISFVRLRDGLPEHLLEGKASFSATVQQAQRSLGPAELVLDPAHRRVRCGDAVFTLPPVEFAFLAWFAHRAQTGKPALRWSEVDVDEFLAEYRALTDELSGDYERIAKALGQGMSEEYFEQRKSRLNTRLKQVLGYGAAPYRIAAVGRRPQTRYILNLRPRQIRFEELNGEENKEGESL